jgi:MoxR-like ATPase
MAKARAVASRRDFVLPDDVQAVAVSVLAHRVIVAPEARASGETGEDAVRHALEETAVPA